MKQYSFDADLRSVLKRLAATHRPATPARAAEPVFSAKVIAFRRRAVQPRIEIAHVTLRPNRGETQDAMT
jgi:hypothetical protein